MGYCCCSMFVWVVVLVVWVNLCVVWVVVAWFVVWVVVVTAVDLVHPLII